MRADRAHCSVAAPGPGHRDLFLITLEKALFSSPAACCATIRTRIAKREHERDGGETPAVAAEMETLRALDEAVGRIGAGEFTKYQALLAAIRGGQPFRWRPNDAEDRLVLFTERIETLRWLEQRLRKDLRLHLGQLATLHGGMSDVDQQRVVEAFGQANSPVRLLVCSDVASEGINLHYTCHRLIHFDMPWSLMVFSQRNGRVDRYGQERTPRIVYLTGKSANSVIRGDQRILEVLREKDDQAYRNIGDPSAFMNVRDIEAEEEITTQAVASGEDAERFDERLERGAESGSEGDDLLALFLGEDSATAPEAETAPAPESPLSLFPNEFAWCEAALDRLRVRNKDAVPHFEAHRESATLTLDAPEDLKHRFASFPREVAPMNWRFTLTTDRHRMAQAITESRRQETAWPALHYLWRLNPVVGWLGDRMLAAFGRREAPILAGIPGLAGDEAVFVASGLVPNRKGHPLVYEWVAVAYRDGRFESLVPFRDLLDRTGLGRHEIPNRSLPVDEEALRKCLPDTVERAWRWFADRRSEFEDDINPKLNEELAALDELKRRQHARIEEMLTASRRPETLKQGLVAQQREQINEIFGEYLDWVQDTMTTEKHPWIKVMCVLTGDGEANAPA